MLTYSEALAACTTEQRAVVDAAEAKLAAAQLAFSVELRSRKKTGASLLAAQYAESVAASEALKVTQKFVWPLMGV